MISERLMQARFKKSLYWPFICSSYICLSHCFNASDPGPLFPNGNYSVSTTRIVVHVFGSPISTDLGLSTHQRIRLSEPLLSSVSCHVIPKLPALSNNAMCNCQVAFQIVIVLARKKYNAAISWLQKIMISLISRTFTVLVFGNSREKSHVLIRVVPE